MSMFKKKQFQHRNVLLIAGYINTQICPKAKVRLNTPAMILHLFALFYEQIDHFEKCIQYNIESDGLTAIRNGLEYDKWCQIYGYNKIISVNETNVSFVWKLQLDCCPKDGIIIAVVDVKECKEHYRQCYGIDNIGLAVYGDASTTLHGILDVNKASPEPCKDSSPIYYDWNQNMISGDIIGIAIKFDMKSADITFSKNNQKVIRYPQINKSNEYRLVVSMKSKYGSCTIIKYQCQILENH